MASVSGRFYNVIVKQSEIFSDFPLLFMQTPIPSLLILYVMQNLSRLNRWGNNAKKPACDGYISAFDVLALFPICSATVYVVSAGLSGLSSEFNQLEISQGGSEVLIPE